MKQTVRLGLLRLVDSAPVMVAQARGLFAANGLDAAISIEPSWSNVADKLTYGLLDAAVMLPPLALAAAAGLRGSRARLVVPLSLSQGGNTITVNHAAAAALTRDAEAPGRGLLEWLQTLPAKPRFAVVHRLSTHNLLLRYWLAAGGVDPDNDIETLVIPPENVVDALAEGAIIGFCAGAPWGSVAEERGVGQVLLGTSSIWPFHPEKCLCVSEAWADASPDRLHALLRAVLRAQVICDRPEEAPAIAELLADPGGLNLPQAASRAALPGGTAREQIRFHEREAWFPARAHATWFLGQMRRWGWLPPEEDLAALTAQVYRPDLLAPAVAAERLYPIASLPELESTAMLPQLHEPVFNNGLRRG
ncbi:MAG TPA: CmpA/NrtA family ABC transporter substrate-binding protein [Rhodopila sp.]|uniref:CmpA/NrtA family ABC transporter substrate-binding protein n=1 Tax=Rhodopila sp. TaxID=2480087 RepID=UPI002C89ADB0|nr:CmpA/NrtA family ABC transporter substrate-binding protein [Rhodopila sp.]HVY17488.1 CmpA/NrtA family ABC transporter substrate-binding protein [Rhodopila sp.]